MSDYSLTDSGSNSSLELEELENIEPGPDLSQKKYRDALFVSEPKDNNTEKKDFVSDDKKKDIIMKSFGLVKRDSGEDFLELITRIKLAISNGKIVGMLFDNKPVMIRRKGGGISLSKSSNNKKTVRTVIELVNRLRKSENVCLFDLSNPSDKIGLNKSYDITA